MKKQRQIMRWIHLIGAAAIGTYVYSPYGDLEWFHLTMQIAVIPILSLTGIVLWKPQWFRFNKKTNHTVNLNAFIILTVSFSITQVNISEAQIRGGAGSFYVGQKFYDVKNYEYFIPANGPSLDNNLVQVGGEGYFLIGNFIIGGGGHYSKGDNRSSGSSIYEIHGGGGYVNIGYSVYERQDVLAYPYIALGAEALGIRRAFSEDVLFDETQFLEANYFVVTPTLDVGVGWDWFPNSKGLRLGTRVGYTWSLNSSPDWRHYEGKVLDASAPSNDLDGFYIRLLVGGGHISKK